MLPHPGLYLTPNCAHFVTSEVKTFYRIPPHPQSASPFPPSTTPRIHRSAQALLHSDTHLSKPSDHPVFAVLPLCVLSHSSPLRSCHMSPSSAPYRPPAPPTPDNADRLFPRQHGMLKLSIAVFPCFVPPSPVSPSHSLRLLSTPQP